MNPKDLYINIGKIQQYLITKRMLNNLLCAESKLELCGHDYCSVVWDILIQLTPPGCITCYHPSDDCVCEREKNDRKYGEDG